MKEAKALIMVDLQNDFCRGGSLEVPDANAVIPHANELQNYFDEVIASKDWHPKDHMSFASNHPGKKVNDILEIDGIKQILWPDHCVQNTKGADFHPDLFTQKISKIIYKGTDKHIDSYSAFFDNAHLRETDLKDYLHAKNIKKLYFMGLATDYCVKYSCLDAVDLGFETYFIEDACRGVELVFGDVALAIEAMKAKGVKVIRVQDVARDK
ncbi:MAG TPA: bifunctional nicotinamidase/pyrazinamidase [Gammaproteobacteria bacterium]|jgi:nicotinamidase/pyrazinamidase|nr:bifunctional nicotinamidase/pyrazinamidase [Gammaproteobacteria bacterium]